MHHKRSVPELLKDLKWHEHQIDDIERTGTKVSADDPLRIQLKKIRDRLYGRKDKKMYEKRVAGKGVYEHVDADTPVADVISDFVHSDNPKFAGKSKKERIKMALGAHYAMQNESVTESIETGQTLADIVKNQGNSEYSPLQNFLKLHNVQVYGNSTQLGSGQDIGQEFSADNIPTFDRAANKFGYDQEQTDAEYAKANPDESDWEYEARLQKARDRAKASLALLWDHRVGED